MDVICIVGPTAVGKTRLSVSLAKRLGGEIISGDSMQIYRGMDIGTAKADAAEQDGVPHHLLDEKNPEESYSVAQFQAAVREKIAQIKSRGKIPIIVGGTGLYIKAVLYDYEFAEGEPAAQPNKHEALDNEALHQLLGTVDPLAAKEIHPNNRKRVLRALAIYEQTGENKSALNEKQEHRLVYDALVIGLQDDRAALYGRINRRVDAMMAGGLLEEVRALAESGLPETAQSMRAIGYKEFFPYFQGQATLEETAELIKRNSRRYAKRQFTWFRNQMEVVWFDVDAEHFDETVAQVVAYIEARP